MLMAMVLVVSMSPMAGARADADKQAVIQVITDA